MVLSDDVVYIGWCPEVSFQHGLNILDLFSVMPTISVIWTAVDYETMRLRQTVTVNGIEIEWDIIIAKIIKHRGLKKQSPGILSLASKFFT